MNGPSKNARLAKIKPNSRGLVVSYFYGGPSRSLDFFFNAKEVSGSQKMYQSRRLAKSRIYHSTPLHFTATNVFIIPYCHPLLRLAITSFLQGITICVDHTGAGEFTIHCSLVHYSLSRIAFDAVPLI